MGRRDDRRDDGREPGGPGSGGRPSPPAFWEALLRRVLRSGVAARSILGDLREEHAHRAAVDAAAAARWYRRAAMSVALRSLADRIRGRPWGSAGRGRRGRRGSRGGRGGRGGPLRALRDTTVAAARSVRRSPRLAVPVVLTLGLGLGANVTMFGLVDRLLLSAPDGVRDADSVRRLLVERRSFRTGELTPTAWLTYPHYRDFRRLGVFADVAAYDGAVFERTLGRGEDAVRIRARGVSAGFFDLLGVEPLRGRLFDPADAAPGARPTAVLSEGFWRRRFGADPGVLGRALEIGEGRYTVVGVTPAGVTGADLAPVDVFLQLEARARIEFGGEEWRESRTWWWVAVVTRLAPGVGPTAAEQAATAAHRSAGGGDDSEERVLSASLVAADAPDAPTELVVTRWLAGVSVLVFLIACANVANLLLVRATRRRRVLSVQRALGLSRRRLVAQTLLEGLLLAALGGVAALLIAEWGGAALRRTLFPEVAFGAVWSTWRIPLFTAAAVVSATCLATLPPVLSAVREDLFAPLKDGARGATPGRGFGRGLLTALQGALTVVLLVGAGLFVRSLDTALDVDLGFEPDALLTASMELEGDPPDEERMDLYYRAVDRARRVPGVSAATFHTAGPLGGRLAVRLRVEGWDSIPRVPGGGPYASPVGPDYFRTLGIGLRRGRTFTPDDHRPDAEPVAVVNERTVEVFWPEGDALGRCLYIREGPCTRVVGVVEDVAGGLDEEAPSMSFYVPFSEPLGQVPGAVVVRTERAGADPAADLGSTLRASLSGLSGQVRFVRIRSYRELVEPHVRSWRLGAVVFSAFGVLALLVAGLGLFSTLAFQVAQRRRELGIRSALGASGGRLIRAIASRGFAAVMLGGAAGTVLAYLGARGLEGLLFGVDATDPASYAAAGLALLALAAVAAVAPAWRAVRSDAVEALRAE